MKEIIEQNAQTKALVRYSQGKTSKEIRETTELSIKDASRFVQKLFPEMGVASQRSNFADRSHRHPTRNQKPPALPAEIWMEITKHLKDADPEATKTLRLVNRQLKDIAERDVKTIVVKNNDILKSLNITGSYPNATKLILINNEDITGRLPQNLKSKLHYLGRRKRDNLDNLDKLGNNNYIARTARHILNGPNARAWRRFEHVMTETEGTTLPVLDAAKAAGLKVSHPPLQKTLAARVGSLFANPAKEKMEHYIKQGFTAAEAASITDVHDEKLISELDGREWGKRYQAQRDRATALQLSKVVEKSLEKIVDEAKQEDVSAAMRWLKEEEQRAEQGQQRP